MLGPITAPFSATPWANARHPPKARHGPLEATVMGLVDVLGEPRLCLAVALFRDASAGVLGCKVVHSL